MRKPSSLSKRDIERLLAEQTKTILHAVDERLSAHEAGLTITIEKYAEHTEKRFDQKLDKLMTTLDRFLKRLTDFEDEFQLLKREIARMKTALREKLGVTI
jgi:ribosomal protein L29